MYSMIGTRPDFSYPVGLKSMFMTNLIKEHWQTVKWVLRYIKGSVNTGMRYSDIGDFGIRGYCDSDYAADWILQEWLL